MNTNEIQQVMNNYWIYTTTFGDINVIYEII